MVTSEVWSTHFYRTYPNWVKIENLFETGRKTKGISSAYLIKKICFIRETDNVTSVNSTLVITLHHVCTFEDICFTPQKISFLH